MSVVNNLLIILKCSHAIQSSNPVHYKVGVLHCIQGETSQYVDPTHGLL